MMARQSGRQLPSNSAPYPLMQYADPDSGRPCRKRIFAGDVGDVAFERCQPIRRFPAYRGKRSHEGRYWFAATGKHVRFESHFEATALQVLDFSHQVTAVSSNPFWLLWSAGSTPARHAPDFFARLTDGSGLVVDVHPTELIGERIRAQHDRARAVCARLGWRYEEFTCIDPAVRHNVAVLVGFSRPHSAPAVDVAAAVMATTPPPGDGGIEFSRLIECVGTMADVTAVAVRAAVFRLMWERRIHFDLRQPICADSVVWR